MSTLPPVGEVGHDEDVADEVLAGEGPVGGFWKTSSWKNQNPIVESPLLAKRSAPK